MTKVEDEWIVDGEKTILKVRRSIYHHGPYGEGGCLMTSGGGSSVCWMAGGGDDTYLVKVVSYLMIQKNSEEKRLK